VFAELSRSRSPRVRAIAAKLAEYAKRPASSCPSLEETLASLGLGAAQNAAAPQADWWKPAREAPTPVPAAPKPGPGALWWK
jgi:hypothetical protein